MNVIVDTCVIIDAMQHREPFCADAEEIILAAADNSLAGFITAKSLTDIYYLMHHYTHSDEASRALLGKLASLFGILDTTGMDCRNALSSNTHDFEDAVMLETAYRSKVDCIVTRNTKDYANASIPVYEPSELMALLR